jgi:uncharacterized membrane protein
MALYEILHWLHVTSAVLWVGGGATIALLATMVLGARDDVELGYIVKRLAILGPRFFAPLSGLTGLFGILLVATHDAFHFSEGWIGLSMLLWIISGAVGGAYLSPRAERLRAGIEASGRVTDDLRETVGQVLLVARVDSVVLLVIVFLMTVKPF